MSTISNVGIFLFFNWHTLIFPLLFLYSHAIVMFELTTRGASLFVNMSTWLWDGGQCLHKMLGADKIRQDRGGGLLYLICSLTSCADYNIV